MFTRVNADLGKRIQTATEAAVAGTTPPKPKTAVTSQFADMKLSDLHAKKQAPHKNAHNFDLFAHKAWGLS
jgi:catalase